jgi:D-beta-D-heptose 7-phosphate kinase/D-beta-D-heptose 1-phosphate adenosyltransferase
VFTNGCFDLLHVGHIRYLQAARRRGDLLVVAVNSDRSVRRLKGPRRPIVPARERAAVLAGLACVDYVVIFDDADPHRVIRRLRPQVLVKGGDWARHRIIGRDLVESWGGRVVRVRLVRGVSTTGVVERILKS